MDVNKPVIFFFFGLSRYFFPPTLFICKRQNTATKFSDKIQRQKYEWKLQQSQQVNHSPRPHINGELNDGWIYSETCHFMRHHINNKYFLFILESSTVPPRSLSFFPFFSAARSRLSHSHRSEFWVEFVNVIDSIFHRRVYFSSKFANFVQSGALVPLAIHHLGNNDDHKFRRNKSHFHTDRNTRACLAATARQLCRIGRRSYR